MVSLSVALIVYGRYRFLDEAVRSIASQTRKPDEVIVFTDNEDAVKKVLIKYGVEAEIYEEPELSVPATYVRIGEVSRTEYVLPLEDDDVFKPEKVEVIERYCGDYPLVKHAADFIDEESRPTSSPYRQPTSSVIITRENAWRLHSKYSYHAWPSTFAVKTSLLRKYRDVLSELKLHSDFAIFILALLEGNVLFVPERLTYYRVGSGHSQLTACDKLPRLVCTWNKYAYDDYFLMKHVDDKYVKKCVLRTYLYHLLPTYLLNSIYDCQFKYEVSYFHVLSACIKYFINYFPPRHRDILLGAGLATLSPLLGRRNAGNYRRREICRRLKTVHQLKHDKQVGESETHREN